MIFQPAILLLLKVFHSSATKWSAKNTPFIVAFISVGRLTFLQLFSFDRISLVPVDQKGVIKLPQSATLIVKLKEGLSDALKAS